MIKLRIEQMSLMRLSALFFSKITSWNIIHLHIQHISSFSLSSFLTFNRLWARICVLLFRLYIYQSFYLIHSFFYSSINSSLIWYITKVMSNLTEDDCMRISKLKGAKNYWPWAIYVQAALESKNIWEIIVATKATPTKPRRFYR